MSNFPLPEVLGRGSETYLQVGDFFFLLVLKWLSMLYLIPTVITAIAGHRCQHRPPMELVLTDTITK